MNERDKYEQAKADMFKVLRTAVRLKHSIAADNELNTALPEAERLFDESWNMRQELPDPIDIKDVLGA